MSLLLILLVSFSAQAFELKTSQGKVFSFITSQNWRISPSCQRECQALKDYSARFKDFERKKGNPASEFCQHVGGNDLIGSYANLDQDSICQFPDESYILSWDLYRKNEKALK